MERGEVADLSRADLSDSEMIGANFSGASLTDARMRDVEARGVNFASANLARIDMRDAAATGSNFARANLSNASFRGGSGWRVTPSLTPRPPRTPARTSPRPPG